MKLSPVILLQFLGPAKKCRGWQPAFPRLLAVLPHTLGLLFGSVLPARAGVASDAKGVRENLLLIRVTEQFGLEGTLKSILFPTSAMGRTPVNN